MLVGSDDVVREVHAAMVAWDGSAGGLSRLPELHAATNLTDDQRELLALAATEVRLARRAHLIQNERLRRERQTLAEGMAEFAHALQPSIRAARGARGKLPDECEKAQEGLEAIEAEGAEEVSEVLRAASRLGAVIATTIVDERPER